MSAPKYLGRKTAAQQHEQTRREINVAMFYDSAKDMTFWEKCEAVLAIFQDCDAIDHAKLMRLGNALCRIADKVERENR